jgi:hypothetical protein
MTINAATPQIDKFALVLGIVYFVLFVCEGQQLVSAYYSKNRLVTYRNGIMLVLFISALCRWLLWIKVVLLDAFYVDNTFMMVLYFFPVWLNFCCISLLCVFYAYVLFEGYYGNYPWYIAVALNVVFSILNVSIAVLLNLSTADATILIYEVYIGYAIFLDTFTALTLGYFSYHFYRMQHRRQRHWLFQSLPKSPETFAAINWVIVVCFLIRSLLVGLLSSHAFSPKQDNAVQFNGRGQDGYHTSYTVLFFYLLTEVIPNMSMLYLLFLPSSPSQSSLDDNTKSSLSRFLCFFFTCGLFCSQSASNTEDWESNMAEEPFMERDSMDFTTESEEHAKILFQPSTTTQMSSSSRNRGVFERVFSFWYPENTKHTLRSDIKKPNKTSNNSFYYFEQGQLKKQMLSGGNSPRSSQGVYQPIAQQASNLSERMQSSTEENYEGSVSLHTYEDESVESYDNFSHTKRLLSDIDIPYVMTQQPTKSVDEDNSIRVIYEDVYPQADTSNGLSSNHFDDVLRSAISAYQTHGTAVTTPSSFRRRPSSNSLLKAGTFQDMTAESSISNGFPGEGQLWTPHQLLQIQQREYMQHIQQQNANHTRMAIPHMNLSNSASIANLKQGNRSNDIPLGHANTIDTDDVQGATRMSWSGSFRL